MKYFLRIRMNVLVCLLLIGIYAPSSAIAGSIKDEVNQAEKLTFDWKFSHSDSSEAAEPGFDDSDWETITVPQQADFNIAYSINGSKSLEYTGPFELKESATIEAVITKNNKPFMTIESAFIKGPLPKNTDPRLATSESDNPQTFNGPKDKEVVGKWMLTAIKRGKNEAKKSLQKSLISMQAEVFSPLTTRRKTYTDIGGMIIPMTFLKPLRIRGSGNSSCM